MTRTRCKACEVWIFLLAVVIAGPTRAIDFRNDIMPVLTKAGCNTGACHGAAVGRGGFRLSLYGGDPSSDYRSIVRELEGRRINLADPEQSLLVVEADRNNRTWRRSTTRLRRARVQVGLVELDRTGSGLVFAIGSDRPDADRVNSFGLTVSPQRIIVFSDVPPFASLPWHIFRMAPSVMSPSGRCSHPRTHRRSDRRVER